MLSKDFKDFIELLNKNEVRYLVVGGYAVAFHGHPRYTKDIDLWIDNSLKNVEKLLAVRHQVRKGCEVGEIGFILSQTTNCNYTVHDTSWHNIVRSTNALSPM